MFVKYSKHNEIQNLFLKMRPKVFKKTDVGEKLSRMIKLMHSMAILADVTAKGKEREELGKVKS